MKINFALLREDIRRIEPEIRTAKVAYRTTPHPWPAPLGAELARLKTRATLLYTIAAAARGRLHLKKCTKNHGRLGMPPLETVTMEDQLKLIGDRWKAYAAAEEAA